MLLFLLLCCLSCLLLSLNLSNDFTNDLLIQCLSILGTNNTNLHALFTLNNLKQSLNSKSNNLLLIKVVLIVLLKELSDLLVLLSNSMSFPLSKCSTWLSKEQMGLAVLEPTQEAADTERSGTTFLSVFLLGLSNKSCYIFNRRLILILESEGLAFNSCHIDQHSGISLESSESEHQVLIDSQDLANCSWVLQFSNTVLLDCQHNAVCAFESNSC